jgi:hypothetical protein
MMLDIFTRISYKRGLWDEEAFKKASRKSALLAGLVGNSLAFSENFVPQFPRANGDKDWPF